MTKPRIRNSPSSLQAKYEEALVELGLYKLLVDNVQNNAIFFMDTDGYIKIWNKSAQKNKGYTASEIVGKHFSTLYSQEDRKNHKPEHELELVRKYGRFEDEGWRISKDGSMFWANVITTSLYDTDGTLIGFAKVTSDLTLRKDQEDDLRAANDLLKNQQQDLQLLNVSKDEFISLASHQLRTPATGVKQYIGMLREGFAGEVSPSQLELLDKAYESNERQLRIISDLLKVAQVDAGKMKPLKTATNVNELITNIINEQDDTFKKRHQAVAYSEPVKAIEAKFDTNLIRMVLENIINNASKYSHDHTTIAVTLGENKKTVNIDVKDQGVGIPKSDIPRLFQKFSRIDNNLSSRVGGSGLGLYWAKKIVDLHSGVISISSVPGVGSIFSVKLPK